MGISEFEASLVYRVSSRTAARGPEFGLQHPCVRPDRKGSLEPRTGVVGTGGSRVLV